jgi:acyl-CoA-binding protein
MQRTAMTPTSERFQAAVEASKQLPRRPDNDTLLQLYALYKQATLGDNADPLPGIFDLVGRAKYDAWASVKGLSRETAMERYATLVEQLRRSS